MTKIIMDQKALISILLQGFGVKVGCIKEKELSESLNVLSDIHFHLKNCINIQFHCSYRLKYPFVYKYMKKITMENLV